MRLEEEVGSILHDEELSFEEKRGRLSKIVTAHELMVLLPEPKKTVALKEPLHPQRENMQILNLSVVTPIFESILNGAKIESRIYNEYYKTRCTYEENGVRYLKPFDAITFYVGLGKRARKVTVALKDITCDGSILYFHLGDILEIGREKSGRFFD